MGGGKDKSVFGHCKILEKRLSANAVDRPRRTASTRSVVLRGDKTNPQEGSIVSYTTKINRVGAATAERPPYTGHRLPLKRKGLPTRI